MVTVLKREDCGSIFGDAPRALTRTGPVKAGSNVPEPMEERSDKY